MSVWAGRRICETYTLWYTKRSLGLERLKAFLVRLDEKRKSEDTMKQEKKKERTSNKKPRTVE